MLTERDKGCRNVGNYIKEAVAKERKQIIVEHLLLPMNYTSNDDRLNKSLKHFKERSRGTLLLNSHTLSMCEFLEIELTFYLNLEI